MLLVDHPDTVPARPPEAIWAVIPAAGIGQRALSPGDKAPMPKQYQQILGTSMLGHTLRAFTAVPQIATTVVVIAPEDSWFATQAENQITGTTAHAVGGASRAESVRNGLHALRQHHGAQAQDWVLVHDAARCLVTAEFITRLILACQGDAVGGLLALPLPDTLKAAQPQIEQAEHAHNRNTRVNSTLHRNDKWLAHTPQMFRLGMLMDALALDDYSAITDESSAIERAGHAPLLVPSSAQNFKVTYPEDFALAQAILQMRQPITT